MDKKSRKLSNRLETPHQPGRPKLYGTQIRLPLSNDMLGAIDAARTDGEARLEVIRAAIERELKRRGRNRD